MQNSSGKNSSGDARAEYRKAGPVGGRLIRSVIALFRDQNVQLPLSSHILISVSGGSDSVALAHLMLYYGRKMVQPSQLTLLHINHQWRGSQSDEEASFVHELGQKWGVPVVVRKIPAPQVGSGLSWENEARRARKVVFREESIKRGGAKILTAHHADDLAETVLWRILTGAAETHGGGILFQSGSEIRPLLQTRKSEIREYLTEVKQEYHEDPTNASDRFLRARMRKVLMPEVERLFPQGISHLVNSALRAQASAQMPAHQRVAQLSDPSSTGSASGEDLICGIQEVLLKITGLRSRRKHLEIIQEKMVSGEAWSGEIHLPEGWRLIRELAKKGSVERWILEKTEL